MANLPAFLMYTGDFYKMEVSCASPFAQWVWWRLEMLMHDSTGRYGYLEIGGKPAPMDYVARRLGITVDELNGGLDELDALQGVSREGKTIYSPRLVEQADQRSRKKKNVHDFRNRKEEGNSKKNNEERNRSTSPPVTGDVTAPLENANAYENLPSKGDGVTSISTEDLLGKPSTREGQTEEPPSLPGPSIEEITAQAQAEERERMARQAAVVKICLISPAGIASGWTETQVKQRRQMSSPIYRAVELEANERGWTQTKAAEWILGKIEHITAIVATEPGWQKWWTADRQRRMFEDGEYRNPSKFEAVKRGGANGTGNGSGKKRSFASDALEEFKRGRTVGDSLRSGPSGGNGSGAPANEGGNVGTVRRSPVSIDSRAVSKGTGTGDRREGVSSIPTGDTRLGW